MLLALNYKNNNVLAYKTLKFHKSSILVMPNYFKFFLLFLLQEIKSYLDCYFSVSPKY